MRNLFEDIYNAKMVAPYVDEAPKRVSFTVTPITDIAAWRVQQKQADSQSKNRRAKLFAANREKYIAMILDLEYNHNVITKFQEIEANFMKANEKYLKYVDKHVYGKNNVVLCYQCKEVSTINTALNKAFYYCRNCKIEV